MASTILGDQIPHHVLFFDRPLYTLPPRVFGCTCYVHAFDLGRDKLDPRAIKYIFLGYSRTHKRYKCYSFVLMCTFVCADVTFNDSLPYFPIAPSDPKNYIPTRVPSLPSASSVPHPLVKPLHVYVYCNKVATASVPVLLLLWRLLFAPASLVTPDIDFFSHCSPKG